MTWTFTIALYFVVAAVLWAGRGRLARFAPGIAAVPFAAQLIATAVESARYTAPPRFETIDWIPSLGVIIGFRVDPLTLVLSAVVSGIGLLIVGYSSAYFSKPVRRADFLALLVLFAGGMAGIVASSQLFGLFVFWEITTVASYLLIGFDDSKAQARAAALQAILVTTAGGLAMLAGFVLLAMAGGTTSIPELVADPPTGTITTVALLLVFAGVFTKSAQVPFHFWLPSAMAAPTPASAYLHSATMVKAGIVVLLFLAPGFAASWIWAPVVTAVGLATMALGSVLAIRQTDLKLLLAYGTVSQLGFMVALLGLDLPGVALAVLVAHSLFKGALFLVVGAVDRSTGTRDLRDLSGVGRAAPGLAAVGALAALSMAGVPPLVGFVTKEAAFDVLIADGAWVALGIIAVASALTVAYAARFWWGAFATKPSIEPSTVARVAAMLIVPPAVLAILSVLLGLVPGPLEAAVSAATDRSVKLLLWPGWKVALAVSMAALAAGALLFLAIGRDRDGAFLGPQRRRLPSAAGVYESGVRGLLRTADVVTGFVQNGSLPVYLAVILTAVLVVPGAIWIVAAEVTSLPRPANDIIEVVLGAIVVAAAIAATRVQRRMAAALLLGLAGYGVAGIFVAFSAPDLALTQLLVETLTVALFALVLARLPRTFGPDPGSLSRRVRLSVAAFVGVFVTAASILVTSVEPDRDVAGTYVDESVEAGGRNVVNIVLTNFRALDTLGEITVLAAAALGISALVVSRRRVEADEEANVR